MNAHLGACLEAMLIWCLRWGELSDPKRVGRGVAQPG